MKGGVCVYYENLILYLSVWFLKFWLAKNYVVFLLYIDHQVNNLEIT